MVLAELGQRIAGALSSLSTVTVVDEAVRAARWAGLRCCETPMFWMCCAWIALGVLQR